MLIFAPRFPHATRPALQRLYDRLPAKMQRGDLTVEKVGKRRWSRGDRFVGYYMQTGMDGGRIELKAGHEGDRDLFVHEAAHHGWHRGLSQEERMEWLRHWTRNKSRMPTDYARSSDGEGFAECVVSAFLRPLPGGYRALDEGTLALVRRLAGG